ncbi:MAG: radical SAM protein [Nitrososphaerota archaeon]|nr:radical SAM protein [Nitrososphaerota archaeon]
MEFIRSIRSKVMYKLWQLGIIQPLLTLMPYKILAKRHGRGIIIEPTNHCNLKCTFCPVNRGMKRHKGIMSLDDFKTIVNEVKNYRKYICMNFAGEPLLDPNIFKKVKYAFDNGMLSMISTNGMFINRFKPDEIFNSNLNVLTIAIDGATASIYEKYRVGGDFDLIIRNVYELCSAKKEMGIKKPTINIQMVIMKHNENEIDAMIKLCKDLGVDSLTPKSAAYNFGIHLGVKANIKEFQPSEKYQRKLQKRKGVRGYGKVQSFGMVISRFVAMIMKENS